MVVGERVRDDDCNSCDIHLNLARVSDILPFLSPDDALDFVIQLCEELSVQDKHNICKFQQSRVLGRIEALPILIYYDTDRINVLLILFRCAI